MRRAMLRKGYNSHSIKRKRGEREEQADDIVLRMTKTIIKRGLRNGGEVRSELDSGKARKEREKE